MAGMVIYFFGGERMIPDCEELESTDGLEGESSEEVGVA